MLEQDLNRNARASTPASDQQPLDAPAGDDWEWEEAGDEEVPTVVLYVVAGLLMLSFTLYLVVGGGHGHFH